MNKMDMQERVKNEIEALHQFFVGWFSGSLSSERFETDFLRRFDQNFLLIPPGGMLLTLDEFTSGVRAAQGTNPDFRIAIRNVIVRQLFSGHVLATYEEWQHHALASTPAENARLASVIFALSDPLCWVHVHETWLPNSVSQSGDYNF